METARRFMLTLFAWILFAIGGFAFLYHESVPNSEERTPQSQLIASAPYTGTGNLNRMSGEQVIGLIPFALNGDYSLVIDGILINQNTDISMVNLRGVPGLMYTLTVTRTNGVITTIYAKH